MKVMSKQSGVTFFGFIVLIAILAAIAVFSMKFIPAYVENGKVQKALDAIVRDPAMQTATIDEIKESFSKRANTIDEVTVVNASDLEIIKDGNKLTISASYSKKIPLAGNVSLLLEFNPSAPQ